MAKIQSATIKACIIKTRKRADGNYPIVIRVQFGGRAERYLPIAVPLSAWDSKRGRVKANYNASNSHNRLISNELLKIEQKKLQFETNGIPYTAKMLLEEQNYLQLGNSLIFKDLYKNLMKVKQYEPHTVRLYNYTYNVLRDYMGKDDFSVLELSSQLLEGFSRWCKNVRGVADGTINTLLARIGVVYRYGIDCGIVDEVRFPYPFKKFKYWQDFKIGMNRFGLSGDVMQILENDYVSRCCYTDGIQGIWWYKEGVVDKLLHKRSSELFIQCLLLMCYKMQGLALTDLVRIKAENITIQKIDGDEYYIFSDLRRKKTGEEIDVISVKRTDSNAVIFDCFVNSMDERDGWFLPLLYNDRAKPDNIVQAMSQMIGKKIKKIFERIDSEHNKVISDLGVDISKITYYTFRHTFASVYVNEKQGNPVYLAQLMGRSVNNIFTYVNGLNNIESLIREKNKMDGD